MATTTRDRSTPSSAKIVAAPGRAGWPVGVRRDGHAGAAVGLGDGAEHPLYPWRDTGFVGGALENRGLHAGVGDALLDVADEQVCHRFGSIQLGARAGEVEEHRYVVVRVNAARGDNWMSVAPRCGRCERNVAAQPGDREIDDGVHTAGLEFVSEPRDHVGRALFLVAPQASGSLFMISGSSTNTCSCISVTPRSAVSMAPRAVLRLRHPADARPRAGLADRDFAEGITAVDGGPGVSSKGVADPPAQQGVPARDGVRPSAPTRTHEGEVEWFRNRVQEPATRVSMATPRRRPSGVRTAFDSTPAPEAADIASYRDERQ